MHAWVMTQCVIDLCICAESCMRYRRIWLQRFDIDPNNFQLPAPSQTTYQEYNHSEHPSDFWQAFQSAELCYSTWRPMCHIKICQWIIASGYVVKYVPRASNSVLTTGECRITSIKLILMRASQIRRHVFGQSNSLMHGLRYVCYSVPF